MIKKVKTIEGLKPKIKKEDNVKVIGGRSRGKTGKVLKIFPGQNRAVVEGVNLVKKHARRTQENQQGGIVTRESTINISNLMFVCPRCNRPSRIGVKRLNDGTKSRFCRRCSETI